MQRAKIRLGLVAWLAGSCGAPQPSPGPVPPPPASSVQPLQPAPAPIIAPTPAKRVSPQKHVTGKQVEDAIAQALSEFEACWKLFGDLRSSGEFTASVRFVISPRGRVTQFELTGTAPESELLNACIARAVKRLRFPKAEKPTSVSLPVRFEVRKK